tara:strand:+ start:93576 stop:94421 length:846 start_codon:yes stop_codon:yes gene_type:complete
MFKIDFLVPGFSKCGTTTLCALLAQHPGIFIPALKEPWYFSAERFSRDAPGYRAHFLPALPGQLLGEGSQSYSTFRDEDVSIGRIYDNNPDCRFIFMVRNPLDRIESSYREMHNSGPKYGINAPYSLLESLEAFPQIIRDSLFFERISKYLAAFGADAIQVLFLEDLNSQPQVELEKCFSHLGVDPAFRLEQPLHLNKGETKLYDARLLRRLREMRWSGSRIAKIRLQQQDKVFKRLRLRRVFGEASVWDARSLAIARELVLPDAQKFLAYFGKPSSFWRL